METALLTVILAAIAGLLGWVIAGRRAGDAIEIAKAAVEQSEGQIRQVLVDKATAETRLQNANKTIEIITHERDDAFTQRNQARLDLQESEKQIALARQEVTAIQMRMADWEKAREESSLHAKAAVLEVAQVVSTKLLADHKQESEAAKKQNEELLKKTNETFFEQVNLLRGQVATLNDQVMTARTTTDIVLRALSSPAGAGEFAELGLENELKSFGLERDRDFLIQHTLFGHEDGARLRPDAIIFLPADSVLVIDSKASKFVVEIASAEGTDEEEEAYAKLARTMNQHLRSLAHKDYRAAVIENYRVAGRTGELNRVLNVMYLPNDAALHKLARCDAEFQKKAAKEEILVVGPTLLKAIIGFARIEIDRGRQAENQERIVEGVQALLESIGIIVTHSDNVGRGIRSAADSLAKLTGSINSRLLPRGRRLVDLGIRPAKGKALPTSVAAYQVVRIEGHTIIEGESEEVAALVLTDQTESD